MYSPLLISEQKYYIQQFAAESFSFLMRKMKDPSELFDILFSELETQLDLCQGLGFLCFEMIKGVKHQFHSMTDSVLPILFSKLGCCQGNSSEMTQGLSWNLVCTVCKGVLVYHKYYLLAQNFCRSLFLGIGDFLRFAGTNFCD